MAENSICRHVSNRDENLRKFATDNDVVVFVAGENSSNGRYLFGVCQQMNPKTWYIQSAEMLRSEWFSNAGRVGVSGATSTPAWLLSDVANQIKYLTNKCG
jgi:4-hydroxy-3-methylbut-2-enyl diphosphate reductase